MSRWRNCDEQWWNGSALLDTVIDADGDGSLTWNDCDDDNASLNQSNDADCDGAITADDCDDSDPLWTTFTLDFPNCAPTTCKEIIDNGFSTGDGNYGLIQPDPTPFRFIVI